MMRVLKVREFTYPTYVGGIEVCLKEICPALTRMGAEIILVTCAERGLPKRSVEQGVDTVRIDFMFIGALTQHLKAKSVVYGIIPRALFLLVLPFHLVKSIKEGGAEILHVHCLSLLSAVPVSLTGWLMKKPVIITMHGTFLGVYREIMPFPLNWLLPILEKTFIRQAYYTKVLVEDRYTIRILLNLGVPKEKIELLLYPGVDVEKFATVTREPSDQMTLLHHGRLVRKRGLRYLVEAFPVVRRRFPDVKLVIAGEGPEKVNLMKLACDLGISEHVNFIGLVRHEKIPGLIEAADVVVIPSLIEGHSTSLLEAMAAGKPIVATKVGGITEVIVDGENGLIVEPKSSVQLSRAIIEILGDRNLAKRLGSKAIETAKEFDIKKLAVQELNVYKRFCGG